jgi:hypothetical protein
MPCPLCLNLKLAFEARRNEYIEASSLAYFRVSKKFAAYMNVEMERARIELQEHRMGCLHALNESARVPVLAERRNVQQDVLRSSRVGTAA